ncbi:hypothetical protein SLEP1_g12028 [Rubroshorea leprosula]|nr:hypothetical protein SLEP1_g12028 [Rubroshorea leprosula]
MCVSSSWGPSSVPYTCYYLVEMEGDLLTVASSFPYGSFLFVYRMDWEKKKWVREKSVGENAFFVGCFCSYPVPPTQMVQVFAFFKKAEYASECILFIYDVPGHNYRRLGASMVSTDAEPGAVCWDFFLF